MGESPPELLNEFADFFTRSGTFLQQMAMVLVAHELGSSRRFHHG
jgi:hypothetical protein